MKIMYSAPCFLFALASACSDVRSSAASERSDSSLEGDVEEVMLEIRARERGLLALSAAELTEFARHRRSEIDEGIAALEADDAAHAADQLQVLCRRIDADLDALVALGSKTDDPFESLRFDIARNLSHAASQLEAMGYPID